jgi:hypothetical protein
LELIIYFKNLKKFETTSFGFGGIMMPGSRIRRRL